MIYLGYYVLSVLIVLVLIKIAKKLNIIDDYVDFVCFLAFIPVFNAVLIIIMPCLIAGNLVERLM